MQAISERESFIVDKIGYDKEGHTVYTKLGNGTEATYAYDRQRERLQAMRLAADVRLSWRTGIVMMPWTTSSVSRMPPTRRRLQNSTRRSWEERVCIRMSMTS